MNITKYSPSHIELIRRRFNKSADTARFNEADSSVRMPLKASAKTQDDLVNRFLNLTDSLPRQEQLSFAASVIANRVMTQGMTSENHSFMQNLSSRFSASEINDIKRQTLDIRGKSSHDGKDAEKLEALFRAFENTLSKGKPSGNIEASNSPSLKPSPEELYFRMSFSNVNDALRKAAFV